MATAILKALVLARQKCLTEDEAYWDPKPDFTRPISARNEAAALSWLLDHKAVVCRGGPGDVAELLALCADYCTRMGAAVPPEQALPPPVELQQMPQPHHLEQQQQQQQEAQQQPAGAATGTRAEAEAQMAAAEEVKEEASTSGRSFEEASAEAALQRWCARKGVRGAASPALFGGPSGGGAIYGGSGVGDSSSSSNGATGIPPPPPPPLRGLRADMAVAPGDVVLHVPSDLLISYETARESDLGRVLAALPLGLGDDSIALIWTCVERREPEAAAAPFWAALPQRFATVLSATEAEVAVLEGSPLHGEALRARQHLRDAFEASSPAFRSLLAAYPAYFQPEWFSWESYVWAAELWYSYGIQVQFAAGDIRTCLAPYLGLMNHHPLPHVVHFSRVDPTTGCLRVRAFRPCTAGRQLFLSYGPYPNAKLLLFYGFALRDNPTDEVELGLQVPPGPTATDRRALLSAAGLSLEHRLRAGGRLPPPLLATARLLAASPPALKQLRGLPPAELKARLMATPGGVGVDVADAAALRLVADAVEALLRPAQECGARLQRQEAVIAAAAGSGGGGTGAAGELRHFARVYVEGVVRILEENLAAAAAVGRGGPEA